MTKKLKRMMKPPEKATAMTLMAIMLVVAAPAFLSVVEYMTEADEWDLVEYDEEKTISGITIQVKEDGSIREIANENWADLNVFYPSENAGYYAVDTGCGPGVYGFVAGLGTSTEASKLRYGEVGRVVLYLPYDVDNVIYFLSGYKEFQFVEDSPGVWILDLTTAEVLTLKSKSDLTAEGFYFSGINDWPADGVFEFGLEYYGLPYTVQFTSTIVAMLVGVALIACAIFATPFVNMGGKR